MSLLKIKTKPLKYEIIVKRARVEHVNDNTKTRVSRKSPSVNNVFKKNKQSHLTNNLSKRVDISSIRVRTAASSNVSSINSLPSNYSSVTTGKSSVGINEELNELKYQKIFDNPNSKMVFLPNVGPQVSYNSHTLHNMGNHYKWEFPYKPTTVYHPGSIKFEITQYPSITMEYIPNILSEE